MSKQSAARSFVLLLLAFTLPALLAQRAYPQRPNRPAWIALGNSNIDGQTDHDSIQVGSSGAAFRAIQLRVSGGTVIFERVTLRYGNGQQQDIPVRSTIRSGGATRAIALPGERRVLKSVDIRYSKANWQTRPRVTLYGLRYDLR